MVIELEQRRKIFEAFGCIILKLLIIGGKVSLFGFPIKYDLKFLACHLNLLFGSLLLEKIPSKTIKEFYLVTEQVKDLLRE